MDGGGSLNAIITTLVRPFSIFCGLKAAALAAAAAAAPRISAAHLIV